jgi:hypothetical protein
VSDDTPKLDASNSRVEKTRRALEFDTTDATGMKCLSQFIRINKNV